MTTEQEANEIPHVVRLAGEGDRRFIVETTAKVRQPRDVPWRTWEPIGEGIAARALQDGAAYVIDAGGVMLGFLLVADGVVEMLYVKRDFRGDGFGLELLRHAGVEQPIAVRASTSSWRAWCRAKGLRWQEAHRNVTTGTMSRLDGAE
jgi:GNAT superfamily N-acetyltransferase